MAATDGAGSYNETPVASATVEESAPVIAMPISVSRPNAGRRTATVVALLFALMFACGLGGHALSERRGIEVLRGDAAHRLDLFAASLDSLVNLYVHVPNSLELSGEVRALLARPGDAGLRAITSRYLERLNVHLGSIGIFVLDTDGIVVAASNWNRPGSMLGADLKERAFFSGARHGEAGRHFAVGRAGGDAGYYASQPIWGEGSQAGEVIGVAVIQISLGVLEETWLPLGTPALIADERGVVIVTSLPDWRYRRINSGNATAPGVRSLPPGTLAFPVELDATAASAAQVVQFPEAVPPLPDRPHRSRHYLASSRRLADTGWQLVIFSDLTPVRRQALNDAALAAVAAGFLSLLLLYLGQRRRNLAQTRETQLLLERANAELEAKVTARTADLSAANERLRAEIGERERAEKTLREAQDGLVQAAKMAALGQLATGISHELAQPLGALRTLSGNAAEFMRRGDLATATSNLAIIDRLVDQMGGILGPLKNFARKAPARPARVLIERAVGNALFLLDARLRKAGVSVTDGSCGSAISGWCDQNRLEQVLVNLIGNAADAMRDGPRREIEIGVVAGDAGRCRISVADRGPGFDAATQAHLFEAFFTTKAVGEGLGLGLVISRDIVREIGGELSAENRPEGGAIFFIDLPPVPSDAPAEAAGALGAE